MIEWLSFLFLILGALFILISAVGILRFPDLFMRMHATTKTTSFGITLLLFGTIIAFQSLAIIIKGLAVIIFIYLTTPLGNHMISKAGHWLQIKKWDNYKRDDMEHE